MASTRGLAAIGIEPEDAHSGPAGPDRQLLKFCGLSMLSPGLAIVTELIKVGAIGVEDHVGHVPGVLQVDNMLVDTREALLVIVALRFDVGGQIELRQHSWQFGRIVLVAVDCVDLDVCSISGKMHERHPERTTLAPSTYTSKIANEVRPVLSPRSVNEMVPEERTHPVKRVPTEDSGPVLIDRETIAQKRIPHFDVWHMLVVLVLRANFGDVYDRDIREWVEQGTRRTGTRARV